MRLMPAMPCCKRAVRAREAVIASILVLEDSPLFNAGKGSVFNAEGGHELDASIMDGHTSKAGAVAGVTHHQKSRFCWPKR